MPGGYQPGTIKLPSWAKILREKSRYKVIYGGRGSGKSRNVAMELLIQGACRPLRVLCCREIQNSISDSVKQMLEDRIRELIYLNAIPRGLYKVAKTEITTPFGTRFFFSGLRSNIDKIKSIEGVDICWIEEAQTISRESLDKLIPTFRKDDSEIWCTINPRFETDPVYADFIGTDTPRPGSIIKRVNWHNNPWFPKVLKAEMMFDMNKDLGKYKHVWEGELLKNDDSKIYKHPNDWETGDIPEMPKNTQVRYGADWGEGKTDPTVLIRLWVDEDNRKLYITDEFHGIQMEYHAIVREFKKMMGHEWRTKIMGDSSRPGVIRYLRRGGLTVIGAKKGKGSVMDGIEFSKSYKIIVHPRCKHVIDELGLYQFKVNKQTEEILNVPEDKNNHTIDAMRYALEPLMHSVGSRITIPKG